MAGDPYFDKVVLGLHCDGTNGSTTFTDVKGKTVTAYGNAQISTTQSKFGGASGLFGGSGDYLSIPDSTDFDFGSGDFTIEAWIYIAADSALDSANGRNATIFANQQSGDATYYALRIVGSADVTGTGLSLESAISGVTQSRGVTVSISKNTWCHIAVSKNSSGVYFSVDGTIYTATAFTQNVDGGSYPSIGRLNLSGWYRELNGYIDDFRITKGVARYTANFTPAASAFPDYMGQISCTLSESTPITDWIASAHDVDTRVLRATKAVTGSPFTIELLDTLNPQIVTLAPTMGSRWAASTAKSLNDYGYPTNLSTTARLYKVTTAGTTGSSEPTWPSSGTVNDGSVVWTLVGDLVQPITHGPLIPS